MWNKIKTQFKKIRTWIIFTVLSVGIVFAAGELPVQEVKLATEFDFNGKIVKTEYTDDNVDENLIIRTDKSHYAGWNETEIFFSIENISKITEIADIQFFFSGEEVLASISELKKDVSYNITVNDYGIKDFECAKNWIATTTYKMEEKYTSYICENETKHCDSVKDKTCTVNNAFIGTHLEERFKDEFHGLALAESKTFTQDIPRDFKAKRKAIYNIPAGEIKFFKAKIEFEPKSEGEFWIAVESLNNKGLLDPWYSSSYTYKRTITLEADEIATTTDNFPVLATTTEDYLKTTTHSGKVESDDGYDIIFVDDDDSTLLDFEYEKYASTTGELVVWVKVDISSTTDKVINMYYGNNGASDISSSTAVWDSNFKMVQHLQETPAGTTYDSTSNNNDGTTSGMDSADQVAGQIDGSLDFDGNDQYVSFPQAVISGNIFTISFWEYSSGSTNEGYFISDSTDPANLYFRRRAGEPTNYDGSIGGNYQGGFIISRNAWHYNTIFHNADGSASWYVDNQLKTSFSGSNFAGLSSALYIANRQDLSRDFLGLIDEVRVSNVARTAGWIETEYNNQSDVGAFLTIGAEEQEDEAEAGAVPTGIEIIWFD